MKILMLSFFTIIGMLEIKQQPKPDVFEIRAKNLVTGMNLQLKLTDIQREKITQYYTSYFKTTDSLARAMTNHQSKSNNAKPEELNAMYDRMSLLTDKKVNSILEDGQKLAYANFVLARKRVTIAEPSKISKQ